MMGYWHDMSGWDYVWMIGMMVLWAVIIAGVVWAIVTLVRHDSSPREAPSAKEELDRRLARGEITVDEYKRRKDLIGSAS